MRGYFASNVRDVTPAGVRPSVRVLYMPASPDTHVSAFCARVLSEAEMERAARFTSRDHEALFIQRRAFRRYCAAMALQSREPLSGISFAETGKGRPYLPQLPRVWFGFASCGTGFIGAWSSAHPIGVDIEEIASSVAAVEMAERYFSAAEAESVRGASGEARLQMFFQLWSFKEAALKSIGEGLPFGLDAFQFEVAPAPRIVHAPSSHGGSERFAPYRISGTPGCAALVTWNAV